MTAYSILIWIMPLLLLGASALAMRFIPGRRYRLAAYLILGLVLFIADLNRVSFVSSAHDRWFIFLFLFAFFEIGWSLLYLQWKPVAYVLLALLWGAVVWGGFDHLLAGPRFAEALYTRTVVDSRLYGSYRYYCADYPRRFPGGRRRRLVLFRRKEGSALEREIDRYDVPTAYSRAEFSCRWMSGKAGPRCDLMVDTTRLWVLGAGY